MRKLKLDLDEVEVESFRTNQFSEPMPDDGTVQGHGETKMSYCWQCGPLDSYPNCPEPSAGGTCQYTCNERDLTCVSGCTSPEYGCV